MAKVAERLDALERKMDVVLGRVSNRSSAPQHAPQNFNRPAPPQQTHHNPQQQHSHGGRMLHKAVCADCNRRCEVPFKPSGSRPTYCKECFQKRKSNRGSHQTNGGNSQGQVQFKRVMGQNRAGNVSVVEFDGRSTRKHSKTRKKQRHAKRKK